MSNQTSTQAPVLCATCGALTFRGQVNVRVWNGQNGAVRHYPAGDHAAACAANVARAEVVAAEMAAMEAARQQAATRTETVARFAARAVPLVKADPTLQARFMVTYARLMGV